VFSLLDAFFLSEDVSFQVREQEFDVNFWIRSLNSLTWVEILRQVLVASGFGSKQHMLNRDFFNKVLWIPQHSKFFSMYVATVDLPLQWLFKYV
jgi:hypothetical protein